MFTLAEKIKVLNSPDLVRVYDAANALRTTAAAISNTDRLVVEGFGKFNIANISDIKLRRAVPATVDSKDYAVVAPAGVAIGDAVEVIVSIRTNNYESEVLAQNHIGNGRTFSFSTLPLTAVTPAAIRTAVVAGYAAWQALFNIGLPIVAIANGAAGTDVKVSGMTGYEGVTIDRVEVRRLVQGAGSQVPVSLAVTVTNSVGFEGMGQGKFLEESIRMATPINTDPYGVDNVDTQVSLRGSYTNISFTVAGFYDENLSPVAADYGMTANGVPKLTKFSLYFNEATCLNANEAIAEFAAIAILRSGVITAKTATVTAAPLTFAEESSEVMIIANNSSVATVAAFIA